jgi:hypothetical protein
MEATIEVRGVRTQAPDETGRSTAMRAIGGGKEDVA